MKQLRSFLCLSDKKHIYKGIIWISSTFEMDDFALHSHLWTGLSCLLIHTSYTLVFARTCCNLRLSCLLMQTFKINSNSTNIRVLDIVLYILKNNFFIIINCKLLLIYHVKIEEFYVVMSYSLRGGYHFEANLLK